MHKKGKPGRILVVVVNDVLVQMACCRFQVVAPFQGDFWYLIQNGWIRQGRKGGGGQGSCESLRCYYYFLWRYTSSYSSFDPPWKLSSTLSLSRCHFRVVASTLLQERKNMAAMLTKLASLHALFLVCICPFVLCTLPSIPDSTVTGTLKPFFLSHKARLNLATIYGVYFFKYKFRRKQFDDGYRGICQSRLHILGCLKNRVSWKQRPLRPPKTPKLDNKDTPIFFLLIYIFFFMGGEGEAILVQ